MAYKEEKRLSRELYEKHEFLRRIVDIYTEGVIWKGCRLICNRDAGSRTDEQIIELGADELRDGVRNMLVDGKGNYQLNIFGNEHMISIAMRPGFPGKEEGEPLLWPATRNAAVIDSIFSNIGRMDRDQMAFSRSLLDDFSAGLGIPYAFFVDDPNTFANTYALKMTLMVFKGRVQNIRRSIEFGIRTFLMHAEIENLGKEATIDVEWNEDWCSNDENGTPYQIFKVQGIDLSTLRDETLSASKMAYENGFISRDTYSRMIKNFI